jgi:hypothetical protein
MGTAARRRRARENGPLLRLLRLLAARLPQLPAPGSWLFGPAKHANLAKTGPCRRSRGPVVRGPVAGPAWSFALAPSRFAPVLLSASPPLRFALGALLLLLCSRFQLSAFRSAPLEPLGGSSSLSSLPSVQIHCGPGVNLTEANGANGEIGDQWQRFQLFWFLNFCLVTDLTP